MEFMPIIKSKPKPMPRKPGISKGKPYNKGGKVGLKKSK